LAYNERNSNFGDGMIFTGMEQPILSTLFRPGENAAHWPYILVSSGAVQ